jgi:dephospho-CoA kinase
MEQKKLVIGISGTICSGKGAVAEILKNKGCHLITLSSIVKDSLNAKGIPITRISMQDEGNILRKEFGGQVLAERALAKYKSYDTPLVIDGIRNIKEVEYLKEHSNFFLIGVDAPFELRWDRIKSRNKDSDLLNHDKFVIDDARDRGFNEPLDGQQVAMCLVHADFLINNDDNFIRLDDSKLLKEVNEIYREIIKRK